MARPIDYSKWDNINTDSDEEEQLPPLTTAPPTTRSPVLPSPQAPAISSEAQGDRVQVVKTPCDKERGATFSSLEVPGDHPVFTQGAISPVSRLFELPLLVYRLDPRPSLTIPRSSDYDNQPMTYLMIDPVSGLAPPEWQQGVGSCIVARQDKKPLTVDHLYMVHEFMGNLLDRFGYGEPVDPGRYMSKAALMKFLKHNNSTSPYDM